MREADTPNRINELRARRGWSQSELARRAGMTPGGVRHIAYGIRHGSLESRWAIAEALGAELSEVFPPVVERNFYAAQQERTAA